MSSFSSQVSKVITQAVLVMKVFFKDLNMQECQFEYSPEATIQQVREMAAQKLGCKSTKGLFLQMEKHLVNLDSQKMIL